MPHHLIPPGLLPHRPAGAATGSNTTSPSRRKRWQRDAWNTTLARHRLRTEAGLAVGFAGLLQVQALLLYGPLEPQVVVLLLLGLPLGWLIALLDERVMPRVRLRAQPGTVLLVGLLGHLGVLLCFLKMVPLLSEGWLTYRPEPFSQPALAAWPPAQWLLMYTLALLGTTALRRVGQLVGARGMAGMLLGRYHQPVPVHRIFLFVDLILAPSQAEQLGEQRYSEMIRDFFRDLNAAARATKGQVYQYTGAGAVVTWPTAAGISQARCLQYFRVLWSILHSQQEIYLLRYGTLPRFKAGAHLGQVMATQVGECKQEVHYQGAVLSTTARIQTFCRTIGSTFLISEELRQRLGPVPGLRLASLGRSIPIHGQQGPVFLVDVRPE